MNYQLIDSGDFEKLEKLGSYVIRRPCLNAFWRPQKKELWKGFDALFTRDQEKAGWLLRKPVPKNFIVDVKTIRFNASLTDFGHIGLFPEHATHFPLFERYPPKKLLNLFAHSGGITMKALKEGWQVTHVDASKKIIELAKENQKVNGLDQKPVRYIVDDVVKFVKRLERREERFDAIVMDPPSFGRGAKNEVFKLEDELMELVERCLKLLSLKESFLLLTSHTPGVTPFVLHHVLDTASKNKEKISFDEMLIEGSALPLPLGAFACLERA